MAIADQFSLYNVSVPAGVSTTAAQYIGNTNANTPLQTPNAMCLFVKGAITTATVTLQVAYAPTSTSRPLPPQDSDFIPYEAAYTADVVKTIDSLNGLWYRFVINNTDVATVITCNLGN